MNRPDNTFGDMETRRNDALEQSLGDMPTMQLDQKGIGLVDRYELLEKLGEGGFGAVYGARDTEAGILVALKALPAEVSCDVEEMTSIRSNFALVSRLHHPGIASVLHLHKVENPDGRAAQALGVKRGDYLVVMEYVPGATLFAWRQALPDKKMPVFQTLEIARQIAAALDYAHSQRVLHRDIKPKNVMLAQRSDDSLQVSGFTRSEAGENRQQRSGNSQVSVGTVKVLDFGLAAEIRSSMSRKSKEPQNSKSGTPVYMAPEQWSGLRQGPAADQYALAVLIYELLGGEVPFKSAFDSANFEIMRSVVLSETPPPLDELDKKQNAVLQQALAKNPDGRFASCVEFVEALAGGKVRSQKSPQKTQKGTKKIFVGVCAIAVAGAAYLSYSSYTSDKAARTEAARVAQMASGKQLGDSKKTESAPNAPAKLKDGNAANQNASIPGGSPEDKLGAERRQKIEQDRIAARVEMTVKKARLEQIGKQLESTDDNDLLGVSVTFTNDPFIQSYRTQIMDYDVALKVLIQNYGANYPEVKSTQAARDALMGKLREGVKKWAQSEYIVAKARFEAFEEEGTGYLPASSEAKNRGQRAMLAGAYREAIDFFLEQIRQSPKSEDYRDLTICYAQINESGKAVVFLGQASSLFGSATVAAWLKQPDFDPIRHTEAFQSFSERLFKPTGISATSSKQSVAYFKNLSWVVDNGGFNINAGTLTESQKGTDYSAAAHAVIEKNVTSFQADFVNSPQGGRGEHQFSFWITDNKPMTSANGYMVVLYWDSVNWGSPSSYMDLIRVDNGNHTVIVSGAMSPIVRDSSKHTIKLTVDGGKVWAELDGVKKIEASDSTYSKFNRVAINSYMKYYDIDARFDNIVVTGQ